MVVAIEYQGSCWSLCENMRIEDVWATPMIVAFIEEEETRYSLHIRRDPEVWGRRVFMEKPVNTG